MEKVTSDGVITVEESKSAETYCEVVEGMQFDRGYLSPYMATDTDKMEAVLDDALHPHHRQEDLEHPGDPSRFSSRSSRQGKKLLIIAEDVEGEALTTLVLNKLRGTFTCVAVKAPGFGDRRKEMLRDIAILTGGEVICDELGLELKDTQLAQLGRARQVKVNKENTIIVGGAGSAEDIKARIGQIKSGNRDHDLRFRPREAPGKTRKALRRRSSNQSRRSHRNRNEGKEAPHRRRPQRHHKQQLKKAS